MFAVMEEGRQKDLQLLEEIIDKCLTHKLLQTIASRDKIFEDQKAMYPFCIGKSLASHFLHLTKLVLVVFSGFSLGIEFLVLRRSCSWFSHSQYFVVLVSLIYTSKVTVHSHQVESHCVAPSHVESINLENVLRQSDNGFVCRFEPDMLAFSGCYYGGGDKERRELASIRRRWKTLHVMPTLHTLREWLH
ncbi:hypothetical protein HID58_082821 [Brassica napus]|uniref:Uncharacterized protein n=1 Tax=Brassica napus TaxID=3708 RepID=A0ABQ7YBP5_BRANA|nr:hypothetical protein HID58_082821 [Brassica napus]